MDKLELVLKEMKDQNDYVLQTVTELDKKARSILASATLITALFGTLQLTVPDRLVAQSAYHQSTFYYAAIVTIFIIFVALVISTLRALWPSVYLPPFKAEDWEEIVEREQEYVLKGLLKNYETVIEFNRKSARRKSKTSKMSIILIGILVSTLVIVSFVPIFILF